MPASRLSVAVFWASFLLIVVGSQGQQPKWLPGERSILDISGVFVDPMPGAPFAATVDIVWDQTTTESTVQTLRSSQQIARDSRGRTYSEQGRKVAGSSTGDPPIDTLLIYDRVTQRELLLNPYTRSAKQYVVPPPTAAPGAVPAESNTKGRVRITNEDLGTRTYENLVLKGVRQTQPSGETDEYWYSPDLSIYVIHIHQQSKLKQTVTVTHIDRSEPDPSKFAIPKNYTVIYSPGGGVTPPQLTHSVNPQYSEEARQERIRGFCIVKLIVDTQGMPQDVHVVRPLGKGLDEKAVEAIEQYRFKPGMYEGHSVPVEVSVMVNFRL